MVPTRVIYQQASKRASRVFPTLEIATEFAKTVRDPFIQPASEPVPTNQLNINKKNMTAPKAHQTSHCACGNKKNPRFNECVHCGSVKVL